MTKQTAKTRRSYVRKIKPLPIEQIPVKMPPKILAKQDDFVLNPGVKYEKHILKLLDTQGFYELWITRIPHTKNYEEAYESAEGFFQGHFDKRRFANYDSFRNAVSHWLKNRK